MLLTRSLLAIILCLSTIAAQATVISDYIGNQRIETTKLEPRPVIMKDEQNNDVMVVFYRLREHKDQHLVGFSIARQVDQNGTLLWDKNDYVLSPTALTTKGMAPHPVMFGDTLYLFGAKGRPHRVQYNSFTSLNDLLNHANPKLKHRSFTSLNVTLDQESPYFSTTVVHPQGEEPRLLLAYHQESTSFSYATCTPKGLNLSCYEANHARNGKIYYGTLNLATVDINGQEETLMFTSRKSNNNLHFYLYDTKYNAFNHRYKLDGVSGGIELNVPDKPSAPIQNGDVLNVYFKDTPFSHIIHKTTLLLDDIYNVSGARWTVPMAVITQSGEKIKTDRGLSVVNFMGRNYVFYVHKDNHVMRYFIDN